MKTAIKICGITRLSDAQAAIACQAEYLGLIFAPSSARKISRDEARNIAALKGQIHLVGVFKNQPADSIAALIEELGLNYVQLHGDESSEFCSQFTVPVIKALELQLEFDWSLIEKYRDSTKYLLFDRPKDNTDDRWHTWAVEEIALRSKRLPPFFFAGGLNGENVAQVVSRLRPFAVDVASSIESRPGIKDHQMMDKFCQSVRGQFDAIAR